MKCKTIYCTIFHPFLHFSVDRYDVRLHNVHLLKLKASIPLMAVIIFIVTIVFGGILEMGEYTYDKYFHREF
jgi:hypothetical protein